MESTGRWSPWLFLALFVAASVLVIWRLEAMNKSGVEGTALGTLIMPYCSGMGNLIFTFVVAVKGGPGVEVMTNSLVNNVTDMTLILGLPAIFWGMRVIPNGAAGGKKRRQNKEHRINRLSLLMTLTAAMFFSGAVWALTRRGGALLPTVNSPTTCGRLDSGSGLVLVGMFLFWQCFHIFDVLKSNVRRNRSLSWMLAFDLVLLGVGAYATYVSVDWLVTWILKIKTGFISAKHLGWLSGWMMVLPNALLAFYYGWTGRPEVVYASQVGDSHISIPLCVGLYALYQPLVVPSFFATGIVILMGAALVHFFFVAVFGRLPRLVGWVLVAAYAVFLYEGLLP